MTRPPGEAATPIERFGYHQELNRSLSFTDLLVYGLIFMVPIAPFGIFGSVFQASGGMVALAYVDRHGRDDVHRRCRTRRCRGPSRWPARSTPTPAAASPPPVGFLAGWMILLDYVLVPGLLYLIAGVAMNSLVAGGPGLGVAGRASSCSTRSSTTSASRSPPGSTRSCWSAELVVLAIFLVIGVVALAQGKGRGFDLTPLYNCRHVLLAAGLRRGLDRGAVASSASTASRCSPRRTRRRPARSAGRWSAALLLAGVAVHRADLARGAAGARPRQPDQPTATRPAPRSTTPPRSPAAHWLAVLTARRHRDRLGLRQLAGRPGRHLPAAVRDGPRPAAAVVPGQGPPRHGVPVNATLLVAVVSLALGPVHERPATTASRCCRTLVNFGALTAFLALHVSVVVALRRPATAAGDWWRHLVVPGDRLRDPALRGDQRARSPRRRSASSGSASACVILRLPARDRPRRPP